MSDLSDIDNNLPNDVGHVSDLADDNVRTVEGILDILPDYGFLRRGGPKPSPDDVYISSSQIRRFRLRGGDAVEGAARPPKEGEKYWGLLKITKVNGATPDAAMERPVFERLTPIFPLQQLKLETESHVLSTRLIDLVAPIGRGQRGMIVSPPKAGKTTLLKEIANGVVSNNPDVELMVILIGERPEEVTDLSRSVKGTVIASNFDESPSDQVTVAELGLQQAKRKVEMGQHVVVLVDSITRLARAHNLHVPPSGRTLSGGFDPAALFPPKKFFGAARNIEEGGSLTIIATALVDTGSRMDDLIYEEFKGTGNMELHLDRKLAERWIYPAIDITRSGTRKQELLFGEEKMEMIVKLRRMIDTLGEGAETTGLLLERLKKTDSNEEFLKTLHERL